MGKFMTGKSQARIPSSSPASVTPETGWDLDKGLIKHQKAKTLHTAKKCCMQAQLGQIMSNKIQKDQTPAASTEVLGAKASTEYKPTHSTTKGVVRPPKPPLLPDPWIRPHPHPHPT